MLDGRKSYGKSYHRFKADKETACLSCEIDLTLLEISEGGLCMDCHKKLRKFEKANPRLLG